MKAVVFGGAGFVGSHVADALSDQGIEVIVYDKKESKYLRDDQTMIVGDILDSEKIKSAVQGCDYVYHYAGIAAIEEAAQNPLKTIETNVLGTTYVLEACRLARVKRIVFASSVYVYSDLAPFYRSSKQSCELIIEDYQKMYGIDYTILRYGSLYGRRADDNNFINKIIKQALEEKRITRYGDGEEIRDYIHVCDAAKCSVDILMDEFKNQHVILTGTQSTKVKDLLVMIAEIMQNKVKIEYKKGGNGGHYEITPYSFRPRVAKKYVSNSYHDLGQGILDVIYDVYEKCDIDERDTNHIKKLIETGSNK